MPRVKRSVHARKKRRKVLEQAKGYWGLKSKTYKRAKEQVEHSLVYAYRDRKNRKRDFRRLWIIRINAAARREGLGLFVCEGEDLVDAALAAGLEPVELLRAGETVAEDVLASVSTLPHPA